MDCNEKCCFCGGDAYAKTNPIETSTFFKCEACGRFMKYMYEDDISKDFLASFLYYNCKISSPIADNRYFCFLGTKEKFEEIQKEYPYARLVSSQEVETWYPRTFSEKIDTILLGFSKLSKYDGSFIEMKYEQYCSAFFVKRYNSDDSKTTQEERDNQIKFIENYLLNNNFIKGGMNSSRKISITLLPDGFKRIYELQKNQSLNSKNVFVAMSFADDMKDVREAIRKAIQDTGHIPKIMDEIEHNNQIVPEMLYEIKQSKFVIAEFTEHNEGAYYEAGYAAGLGKEVIHICKKDSFDKDIHFDVKQVNTIIWETEAELTEKLSKRIKATIE
jgi:nucleoside 2-deoxyribosyltransferase